MEHNQTRIKICGLRRLEDVSLVNSVQPHYAGFVFAPSKRQVTSGEAHMLRSALQPSIQAVGVFVNATLKEIAELCQWETIQLVQLHGQEDASYIQQLRQLIQVPIIKAVRVRSTTDIFMAQQLECDYLLLDTYVAGMAGGSGQQFEYDKIPSLHKPFFLAGGLTADNVQHAIKQVHPFAVDVSSGVEQNGWKDAEKVRKFMRQVQTCFC